MGYFFFFKINIKINERKNKIKFILKLLRNMIKGEFFFKEKF